MQIDVELLFSSDPFGGLGPSEDGAARDAASRFAFVKPRATGEVELQASSETTTVTLSHVLPQLGCARPPAACSAFHSRSNSPASFPDLPLGDRTERTMGPCWVAFYRYSSITRTVR